MAVPMSSDGRLASERWQLTYISLARDLPKSYSPDGAGPVEMLQIADPDYDENDGENTVSGNSRGMPMAYDGSHLPVLTRLEGTCQEMESLTTLLGAQGASRHRAASHAAGCAGEVVVGKGAASRYVPGWNFCAEHDRKNAGELTFCRWL